MPNAHLDADKDAPLRYDIRLLGRILGETIRAQEGERTFDTIERIRLTALRFHRDADPSAARELQNNIRALGNGEAIQIIRAFGHFSHLANIAEDQHHIRRSRAYAIANAAPRKGEIAVRPRAGSRGGAVAVEPGKILCNGPVQPGPDSASNRSPPSELDRPRNGDRATPR